MKIFKYCIGIMFFCIWSPAPMWCGVIYEGNNMEELNTAGVMISNGWLPIKAYPDINTAGINNWKYCPIF